jgi:NADH-quinone oxidoreductase subunit E
MGETLRDQETSEVRQAAQPSFANASAKFMADQAAVMTMMTAVGVNLAAQMTGIFMGAFAQSLQKPAAGRVEPGAEEAKVVPLRVVPKAEPEEKIEPEVKVEPVKAKVKPEPPKAKAAPVKTKAAPKKKEAPKVVAVKEKIEAPEVLKTDDLKRISGVGPRLEKVLHGMGIKSLADIAKWNDAELRKMDEKLGLDNRAIRDDWVKQAKALLEG